MTNPTGLPETIAQAVLNETTLPAFPEGLTLARGHALAAQVAERVAGATGGDRQSAFKAGLTDAAICGVSFGGLVALHFAARRPERTRALVLVSTPSPDWTPGARVQWYLRAPRLLAPVFAALASFLPAMLAVTQDPADTLRHDG